MLLRLNNDVLHCIADFCDINTLAKFRQINSTCLSFVDTIVNHPLLSWIVQCAATTTDNIMQHAAIENRIDVIEYCMKYRVKDREKACHRIANWAASRGHVALLNWVIQYKLIYNNIIYALTPCLCWLLNGVRHDQVRVLEWFDTLAHDIYINHVSSIWNVAAENAAEGIMKWVCSKDNQYHLIQTTASRQWFMRSAVKGGSIEICKLAMRHCGSVADDECYVSAARHNHPELFEWLCSHRIPDDMNSVCMTEWAVHGNIKMVKFCHDMLHQHVKPRTLIDVLVPIVKNRHSLTENYLEIINYLLDLNPRCVTTYAFNCMAQMNQLNWMKQTYTPSFKLSRYTLKYICYRGWFDVLVWWHNRHIVYAKQWAPIECLHLAWKHGHVAMAKWMIQNNYPCSAKLKQEIIARVT